MKNGLLLPLLLAFGNLLAQTNSRGSASAMGAATLEVQGNTRALIVGISEYADSGIVDLRFAHRDAEIFTDYLRSANGAALPKENVRLILNEHATLGAIDDGLNWLVQESKKGDKVIIYFSGHGDVEKQTLWQRGYLLAHNTPGHNFRNNAVKVEDLDEIVKTLSVNNEAKVLVILDACRSGKLANTGPALTAEQLEKQVENEVRILSCKPDQKSLEGENWGQGRGLFSFFLVNGMMGLADSGTFPDQIITLEELTGFVKTGMQQALSDPSISARQNPVFVGDEGYEVAEVNPTLLGSLNTEIVAAAAQVEPKGIVENGAEPSSPAVGAEDALNKFIEYSRFDDFVTDSTFADLLAANNPPELLRYFTDKIAADIQADSMDVAEKMALLSPIAPAMQDPTLHQRLQLQLAAELHDQAQTAINDYLRGDPGSLDKRYYADQAEKYVMYPRMLQAALVLLPKDHLLHKKTAVKLHYFDGVCTRLAGQMSDDPKSKLPEALAKQRQALALDDKAPYIHNEMGLLQTALSHLDSAILSFEKAAELAPNWALPKANLCGLYNQIGQHDQAIEVGMAAITLQPDYFGTYVNLGTVVEKAHDLLQAETYYRKARSLNDPHYLPYQHMAEVQLESARYAAANWNFHEMELRKKGTVSDLIGKIVVDNPALAQHSIRTYPELSGPGIIYPNPVTAQEFFMTGKAYYERRDYQQAEPYFKQAMRLDPNHLEVYYYLGDICLNGYQYEEAEVYFKRLIPLRPEVDFMPLYLADVYRAWERPQEEEKIYWDLIANKKAVYDAYNYLHELLHRQKRYSEEELLFWEGLNKSGLSYWAIKGLTGLYSHMNVIYPNDANWLYRKATFDYEYSSHYYGVLEYERVIKMDSNFAARPFMHAIAGAYYLKEGSKRLFRELNPDWAGDLPNAISHLRQAARLAPQLPSAKYDLAVAYEKSYDYEAALSVLEALLDSNDLNFDSRLQLADLFARSGRFEEAYALLDKAWDIQPEPVEGLPGCTGKLKMLQGETAGAIEFYLQEFELAIASEDSIAIEPAPREGMRSGDADDYDVATSTAYTLARLYARLGKKEDSMEWLKKAFARGFDSKLVVKYDPALDGMRGEAGFMALLATNGMK